MPLFNKVWGQATISTDNCRILDFALPHASSEVTTTLHGVTTQKNFSWDVRVLRA